MGLLVDGKWQDRWYDTGESGGRFVRSDAPVPQLGDAPTAAPGPSGEGGFKAEPGRYHLYVSLACPWAHRTLIFRKLKGLEGMIGVSVVHWLMARAGLDLRARRRAPPATRCYGSRYLHEIYTRAEPDYTGRVTVPVLWDQRARHDRQQRVVRDHPDAELGVRRRRRRAGRLLPRAAAGGDRPDQRARLRHRQQRRLPGRVRHHAGGLRRGGDRAVRHARLARGAAGARSAISPASGSPRPTGACSRRSCASTRSITATSSATCAGWSTTRTCGPTRASSTSGRASPRRSTSPTSSATTTAAMAPSTRPASCPRGPLIDFAAPHGRDALPAAA